MIRYQSQNFSDQQTLYAKNLQQIEQGIINLENELIASTGTTIKSVNLFDITDITKLFADGKYRGVDGIVYTGNDQEKFHQTYPSSEKIYIGDNDGPYHLDLEPGKTYRWQFVPYYEFGYLHMATPWGDGSEPGGFKGRRFWFYDASDNLIANDSTTSSDGVYLMTIPAKTAYMRFMGWNARSDSEYASRITPLYSTLMVTEGEKEYLQYIKPGETVETPAMNNHGCYCDFNNEVLSIVYHYNETSDMMVQLKKKGPNSIVDISGWYTLPKKSNGDVQDDIDSKTIVTEWGSDFHGPFSQLNAINNPLNNGGADSNGNTPPSFTGGNHGYKNTGDSITTDPQNTPTGRSDAFKVSADGRVLSGGGVYCDRVDIYWENFVQGRNTVKPDGSGREILKEIHEVTFYNGEFHEEVRLIPLENINIIIYYGLQGMDIRNKFGDCVYYGGSKNLEASRKMHATSVTANSCTKDACQAMCIGPQHTLFIEIDPTYDMGTRWAYTVNSGSDDDLSSIKCGAGEKLYFQLIRAVSGINMYEGQAYSYRCKYGIKPTKNTCAVRAISQTLDTVNEKANNPTVALVGHNTYLYYSAKSGSLPKNVSVENASYTWDASTGELKLYDITASVTEKVNIKI